MPAYADRVQETSATTGTGTLTLAGAVAGYQAFSAAVNDGDRVYFCVSNGTAWEVSDGVYTLSGTTLTRENVYESSNANALVNFTGTLNVFIIQPAETIADISITAAINSVWIPW
jgi:hypothetical protein